MACRYIRFEQDPRPEGEWVPMALRDTRCLLRSSDPERWTAELIRHGIEVEPCNTSCLHNLTATWDSCPLFSAREPGGRREAVPVDRNEFGYPLRI